jgi:hypothetical protein
MTAEKTTTDLRYRAILDYLLADLLILEGRYTEGVNAFVNNAAKYKGTNAEAQMLGRASVVYSCYMN